MTADALPIRILMLWATLGIWAGCSPPPKPVAYDTIAIAGEGGFAYQVDSGCTDDRVVFLVIQKTHGKAAIPSSVAAVTWSDGHRTASGWYEIPGEGRVDITKMQGGYEADDSGVRHHNITFTPSQLRAFFHKSTTPKEVSFGALDLFVKSQGSGIGTNQVPPRTDEPKS